MPEREDTLPSAHPLQPACGQRRMSFLEAVTRCLQYYATFQGRATRAEYWWFMLFSALVSSALTAAFMSAGAYGELLSALSQLTLFLPGLAVGVRRLHDTGRSGWWMLISLTIVGLLPLWIFFCLRSQPASNNYGEVPCVLKPQPSGHRAGELCRSMEEEEG